MRLFFIFLFSICNISAHSWGFFAHQRINRLAVYTLPPEMVAFYKAHIAYLTDNAINPDKRRYAIEGEAPKHYIDIDIYGDSAVYKMPRNWKQACEKYSEDTLKAYGINPWWVVSMKYQLTEAMKVMDGKAILRLSADLGHYIADGNVPLHSTHNYNGQYTNQYGIHGFWESRLPELFSDQYDFFVGRAEYLPDPQLKAWEAITKAHVALDSVLRFEKLLTEKFSPDQKYSFEERNGQTIKVYSKAFSKAYHTMLAGQVERRMCASVKMVGDFWYTCWVDAGQPDLSKIIDLKLTEKEKEELKKEKEWWQNKMLEARPEGSSSNDPDHHAYDCCGHHYFYGMLQKAATGE